MTLVVAVPSQQSSETVPAAMDAVLMVPIRELASAAVLLMRWTPMTRAQSAPEKSVAMVIATSPVPVSVRLVML